MKLFSQSQISPFNQNYLLLLLNFLLSVDLELTKEGTKSLIQLGERYCSGQVAGYFYFVLLEEKNYVEKRLAVKSAAVKLSLTSLKFSNNIYNCLEVYLKIKYINFILSCIIF